MTTVAAVLDALRGARVNDVCVPGWLDRTGGVPRFVAATYAVYLELDHGRLAMTQTGNDGSLALETTTTITPLPDGEDDFATGSVGNLYLPDGHPMPMITGVRYWTNDESDPDRGIVRCAEFRLGEHITLFADPMWLPGIRFVRHGFDWDDDELTRHNAIFGRLEEHSWQP